MIARVTASDGMIYDSAVFAIEHKGWNSKVILFDQNYSKLIILPVWNTYKSTTSSLVIIDYNTSNWSIVLRMFKSYWNIKNIFSLVKNQKYDSKLLLQAKSIQDSIRVEEWNRIKSQHDAEELINASGAFHDAYIERLIVNNGYYEILFNTTWGTYVLLKCEEVLKSNLVELDIFYEAMIECQDGKIALHFDDEYRVIEAKKICWKLFVQHKYLLYDTDFLIENNRLMFHDYKGKAKAIDMGFILGNEILAFKENNMVGIINYSENNGSYNFIDNKSVHHLSYHKRRIETKEEYKFRFYKLKNMLEKKIINSMKMIMQILFQEMNIMNNSTEKTC